MISSEQEYLDAMRKMIRKVQAGYEPPFTADVEELEVFAECIRRGYLIGSTTYINSDGHEVELRTLDGKIHPELANHVIPPKGLAFLEEEFKQRPANYDKKKDSTIKKAFQLVKQTVKRFWALFCGLSVIVTVFGWPLIKRFFAFLFSFFQ